MWRHLAVVVLAGFLLFLPAYFHDFWAGAGAASLLWLLHVTLRDVTGGETSQWAQLPSRGHRKPYAA